MLYQVAENKSIVRGGGSHSGLGLLVVVFCWGTGFDDTVGFLLLLLVVVGVLLFELLVFAPIPANSQALWKKEDKNIFAVLVYWLFYFVVAQMAEVGVTIPDRCRSQNAW